MEPRSRFFGVAIVASSLMIVPKAMAQQAANGNYPEPRAIKRVWYSPLQQLQEDSNDRVEYWIRPWIPDKLPVDGAWSDPQAAAKEGLPRLKVLVCDQARVASKTLGEGQRLASRVFLEAGIVLEWLDAREHSVTEADYILRINCCFNKLKSTLPDRTVAFAPAGGRHVTVFWDRIAVEAAAGSHDEAMLLGYVIAHEMGHLLLPPGYHSPYGIMQSRMHYEDLSQARRLGNLFFSQEEAARMHTILGVGVPEPQLRQAVSGR